jgi:serine/threonine protein kinase
MAGVGSFLDKGPDSEIPAWLASEPAWVSRVGAGWQGRFLAKGSYGAVGAWRYDGPQETAPAVKEVVVKMASFEDFEPAARIYDEGNILKTLNTARSRHIIRQFGGNRTGDKFGDMYNVVKIFLEYCPGGDLTQFLREYHDSDLKDPLHEVDIWAIFYCLALGVLVMHRGTEDLNALAWNGGVVINELVHFDIKFNNSKHSPCWF